MGAVARSRGRSRAAAGLAGGHLAAPPPSRVEERTGRTRDLLDRAGLAGTTVGGVWTVCAISAAVAFVAIQVVSRTATVALAFGLMAGYLPLAMLAGRARRRQRELAEVWPEAVDNLASRGPGRSLAAGGADPARAPRAGAAARAVPGVRRRLPGHRPVRRQPRPAQGAALRPGRRPGRRGPADRPRGRWRRAGQPAAQPVGLPARGRAHPVRAGVAAGLDRQRRAARGRGAVAGAADALLPARGDRALRVTGRRGGARGRRRRCASSPTARWSGSAGCRPSGGCCRDAGGVGRAAGRGRRARPGAGGHPRAGAAPTAARRAGAALRPRPAAGRRGRWPRRRAAGAVPGAVRPGARRRRRDSWSGCSAATPPSAGGSSAPGCRLTVHDFRVEQVLWGLVGVRRDRGAVSLLVALRAPGRTVPLLVLCAVAFVSGVLLRENRLTAQVDRAGAPHPRRVPDRRRAAGAGGRRRRGAGRRPRPGGVPVPRRAVRRARRGARRHPHRHPGRAPRSTRWPAAPGCRSSRGSPRAWRSPSSAARRWPTCCTRRPPTSARPGRRALIESGARKEIAMMVPGRVPRPPGDRRLRVLARRRRPPPGDALMTREQRLEPT